MPKSPISAFSMYQNQAKKPKLKRTRSKRTRITENLKFKTSPTEIHLKYAELQKPIQKKKDKMLNKKKAKVSLKNGSHSVLRRDTSESELQTASETSLLPKVSFTSTPNASLSSSDESTEFYNVPHQVFEWIIAPIKSDDFFRNEWEKAPLLIKRNLKNYYNQILTTEKLDDILHENSLFYTRNIDVVSYVDGQRETHNPEGRAVPAALWDYYQNGCSIRILNPHTYCPKLHSVLAALQEYFGCMAGVNAYLTPPGSQGFAPHYDDIEAFVLQLEGRKHWKLYAPLTKSEVLPRFSSKNLDRNELKAPIKEVTLEAGDLLYFPRGTIHEGFTDADAHSLHITVSVYQKVAYVDLLEHILKPALMTAAQEDIEFRKGLPLQYLQQVGLANSASSSKKRDEIVTTVKNLFAKIVNYIDVDTAADQLGKQFIWDSMPPVPSKHEKTCMVSENGERMLNGEIYNKVEITLEIEVRLVRYHCIRIVKEDEEVETNTLKVYYNTENAKYYHGEDQQFIVIDATLAPAVKCLLHSYPRFIAVKSLPLNDDVDKMQIVSDLWEKGLLVTYQPLDYD